MSTGHVLVFYASMILTIIVFVYLFLCRERPGKRKEYECEFNDEAAYELRERIRMNLLDASDGADCASLAHPDSMSGYISTDIPVVKPKFRTSSKLLKDAIRRSEMNSQANRDGFLVWDTLVVTETKKKAKKPSNKKRVTIRKKQVRAKKTAIRKHADK